MRRIDEWNFSGNGPMHNTLHATAISDQSASYVELVRQAGFGGVVRLTSTGHGYKATTDPWVRKKSNLVFVSGLSEYNGLRVVLAEAANTIDIAAPFVAKTPDGDGSEKINPGFQFDHDCEFIGFDLSLDIEVNTAENLTINVESAQGAAWNRIMYTLAMGSVKNASINFKELSSTQRFISSMDRIYFEWDNSDARLWGLTIYTMRSI